MKNLRRWVSNKQCHSLFLLNENDMESVVCLISIQNYFKENTEKNKNIPVISNRSSSY